MNECSAAVWPPQTDQHPLHTVLVRPVHSVVCWVSLIGLRLLLKCSGYIICWCSRMQNIPPSVYKSRGRNHHTTTFHLGLNLTLQITWNYIVFPRISTRCQQRGAFTRIYSLYSSSCCSVKYGGYCCLMPIKMSPKQECISENMVSIFNLFWLLSSPSVCHLS